MHLRVFTILVFLSGFLAGWGQQLYLVRDTVRPANPKVGTWFYDPVKHRSTYFGEHNWESFTENAYKDIYMCQSLMILHYNYNEAQLRVRTSRPTAEYCVRSTSDRKRMTYCDHIICHDSIIAMIWDNGYVQFSATRSGIKDEDRFLTSPYRYGAKGVTSQIVQSRESYCAPEYIPKFQHPGKDDPYRNWGMLSVDAQWIVAPKFDAPFFFENGIAEVLYYGQRRKINEKGEFVE